MKKIIGEPHTPKNSRGRAFAPSNIALCKYWGKRDTGLNLPVNTSLSVSLGHLGTATTVAPGEFDDRLWLNDQPVDLADRFLTRLRGFLDLYRPTPDFNFDIRTDTNFPIAAGLASSASGFAALVLALDDFFGWNLDRRSLSILARLGSGSACRSVYYGFVEWFRGQAENGLDSYAEQLPYTWPELRLAVITVSAAAKPVGSTEGMQQTVASSTLYKSWPAKAAQDLEIIRRAIQRKNFAELGATVESNALAMHATMIDTWPPVLYWLPETVAVLHKIWKLRKEGLEFYFTIDAGPNVKVLFEEKNESVVREMFAGAEIIRPFEQG